MNETTKVVALLADGSLALDVHPSCVPFTTGWVPRFPSGQSSLTTRASPTATIHVGPGKASANAPPADKPLLCLYTVSTWMTGAATVLIHGQAAGIHGTIDLESKIARIIVPLGNPDAMKGELFTALTITSAFLLGRLGRTLIHAAAAVDPEGHCWLLVGDTHAGKTTTTINLVRGGWGFLSDDHVVASADSGGPEIEGWPRPFHVDEGWQEGRIVGRRGSVEPAKFGTARWLRSAPLAGLLFPEVRPDEPTRLQPLEGAAALTRLIRQTPWLMVDPAAAGQLLSLLARISAFPAFHLSVGKDSYADSTVLLAEFARR